MTALLSTTYFGPVQWYQKLCRYDQVVVDTSAPYRKQTYRNRCLIATTNGVQALTVPVEHPSATATHPAPLTCADIRISNHGAWRHLHWQAITSAYGESPFFEYYEDDLRPFFEPRWEWLTDFNEAIRAKMCELLDVRPCLVDAPAEPPARVHDFRDAIRPKHPEADDGFRPRRYYQVYERKHGFLPNLSVLDLLLNMGPEGIFYLLT